MDVQVGQTLARAMELVSSNGFFFLVFNLAGPAITLRALRTLHTCMYLHDLIPTIPTTAGNGFERRRGGDQGSGSRSR